MSDSARVVAVSGLRDAYPRQPFPDASIQFYLRALEDLDGTAVAAATERLCKTSTWLPSVAEIREAVGEAACGLPIPAEAWTMACAITPVPGTPQLVRDSMDSCGGRWSIVHSERPETTRAQFLADYEARRRKAIESFVLTGHVPASCLPVVTVPEAITIADVPALSPGAPRPEGWPEVCGNCGADWTNLSHDIVNGFCCSACGACDSDE